MQHYPHHPDSYLSDPVWAALFAEPAAARQLDWGRRHLRFAAADAARSLVSRGLIEHWLLYGNLRYPQLNVSYGGEAAPPTSFTRTRRLNQHQLPGSAHADDVIEQLDRGATLVLSNPEQWDERTARFCADLSAPLLATVQSYVYLTAPDEFGSRPHRDEADVFVVQVEGSKEWTLYDLPADDDWHRGYIDESTPVTEKLVLHRGDGLYVPSGMGHRARSEADGSLHLTISVGVPPLRAVVEAWAAQVVTQFARHERVGVGPAGRVSAVHDVLRRIEHATAAADPKTLAAAIVQPGLWPVGTRRLSWPSTSA
jgi:hypothetical protein